MDETDNKPGYNKELYTEQARRDRFLRIAEKRTNRVLEGIRMLGNTSNKSLYKYDQGDVDKIFATIEKRLLETRAKFKTSRQEKPFKFD